MVGRHFAHRAPQCISSKTKVRQVLIHLLGVISSSVLPPSCRVIFNTPFWRRPFGCPSGEVGGTVVSAATLRNLHCLVCGQKMFANRRSMSPSHNKYASFVFATFPPNPCCSYTASTGSLTVLALRKLFEQHFIDGPYVHRNTNVTPRE